MENLFAFLGAFGVGSIITSLAQWHFTKKFKIESRKYDERKEAYIGLLESWVRQEDNAFSEATERDVGHWHLRAQLVASKPVYDLLQIWFDTEAGSTERIETTKKLKLAMRDDLRTL